MKKEKAIAAVFTVFISVIMIIPIAWGLILSFKDNFQIFNEPAGLPSKIDLLQYIDTFRTGHLANLFKNSLAVTTISVLAGMLMVYLSSFSIARLHHKNKGLSDLLYYTFLAATTVPAFVLLMTTYNITMFWGRICAVFGIDHLLGLILPYIAAQISFSTLMLVGAMKGIPLEMEEAAIIDGCSLFNVIFRIDLRLIMPIITTLFIFTFLGIWNEFPIASILLSTSKNFTIPMAMAFFKDQYSADYGAMMRCVIIILIPQLAFYFVFQKQIIEGMASVGIKG